MWLSLARCKDEWGQACSPIHAWKCTWNTLRKKVAFTGKTTKLFSLCNTRFYIFSRENDKISFPSGLWRILWRKLKWLLWTKRPETDPEYSFSFLLLLFFFLQKKIFTGAARKCGFEQGRQMWVGSHWIGHFPSVFPMKPQLASH